MCSIHMLAPQTARLLHSTQSISSVHDVVKELVENSLDSGATNITVKLVDFGYEKIEVGDNGCGIPKSDLPYVVLPHYTSKIVDFADLRSLNTYGFRGQGLAAVAALSDVTVTSRCRTEEVGHAITFDQQGKVVAQESLPFEGTAVTVKQLFKNVPVRRKHLSTAKNKAAGLKQIERLLSALAIAWPGLRLCLYHDKSLIWKKIPVQTFGEAVGQVFGFTALSRMEHASVRDEENDITIEACLPKSDSSELSSSDSDRTIVLINRRHVVIKDINQAIQKKYAEATGATDVRKYPSCVISIDIKPSDVDVNYEPNKMVIILVKQDAVLRLLGDLLDKVYSQPVSDKRADKENRQPADKGFVFSKSSANKTNTVNGTPASDGHSALTTRSSPLEAEAASPDSAFPSAPNSCPATAAASTSAPASASVLVPPEARDTTLDSALHVAPSSRPSHTLASISGTDRLVDQVPHNLAPNIPSGYSEWFQSPDPPGRSPVKQTDKTLRRQARCRSPFTEGVSPGRQLQFKTGNSKLAWSLGFVENSQGKVVEPPVHVVPAPKRPSTGPVASSKRLTLDPRSRRIDDLVSQKISPAEAHSSQSEGQQSTVKPSVPDERTRLVFEEGQRREGNCKGNSQTEKNSRLLSRKEVTTTFSLEAVIKGFEPYCLLTQTSPTEDDEMAVVCRLSQGWLVRHGTLIYALNAFRLKEAVVFRKLADTYALPMDPVFPPIEFDQNSLGKPEMWKTLTRLQTGSRDFTGASYVTDQLLLSNGFEVRFPLGTLSNRAEIVQKARNVDVGELKEILARISEHPSGGCSLRQSRPAKTLFYLQGEAARMVQSTPAITSLEEIQELMQQSKSVIDDACIHTRPVCTKVFELPTLT